MLWIKILGDLVREPLAPVLAPGVLGGLGSIQGQAQLRCTGPVRDPGEGEPLIATIYILFCHQPEHMMCI